MNAAAKLAVDFTQRIRNLAEIRTDEPVVISAYLNLDPTEFPTQKHRESAIEALIDDLRAQTGATELSHDGRQILDADIERVREWMKDSMDPAGAHGVAVFCCTSADLFEVFRLSSPIGPAAYMAHTAHVEPLTAALPADNWCVFLVNRRNAKILRGSAARLVEVGQIEDDVHGKHDQGGLSQARYQRSVEKDVTDHIQNACERLFEAFGRVPFDKLLVGCPAETWPEVESKLHQYLSEKVIERFDAEVEHENPDEVLERARPLMKAEDGRVEAEMIERLAEQLGRNERAAAGLDAVLDALNASRVDVLLLTPGFTAPGVACPQCGWLGTQGKECPADRTSLGRVDDIVPSAIRSTILQSASVHEVQYHEPDTALGGPVAALLRF